MIEKCSMNDKSTKENASNLPADKIIATVVLWLDEKCSYERWDLYDEKMCVLLSGITVSTRNKWKETAQINDSLQVDQETIDAGESIQNDSPKFTTCI